MEIMWRIQDLCWTYLKKESRQQSGKITEAHNVTVKKSDVNNIILQKRIKN